MSDAVALTSLSGFDNLGESARASIAYHLGLPRAALRGASDEIQKAHSSAVRLVEGASVEIFGMRGRTDLNGQSATLLSFQPATDANARAGDEDRWACRIAATGEQVRVRVGQLAPANLAPWWGEEEEGEQGEEEAEADGVSMEVA